MRNSTKDELREILERYPQGAHEDRTTYALRSLEERLAGIIESTGKWPSDSMWKELWQFLQRVWARITGKTTQPTDKELLKVLNLLKTGSERRRELDNTRNVFDGEVRLTRGSLGRGLGDLLGKIGRAHV